MLDEPTAEEPQRPDGSVPRPGAGNRLRIDAPASVHVSVGPARGHVGWARGHVGRGGAHSAAPPAPPWCCVSFRRVSPRQAAFVMAASAPTDPTAVRTPPGPRPPELSLPPPGEAGGPAAAGGRGRG